MTGAFNPTIYFVPTCELPAGWLTVDEYSGATNLVTGFDPAVAFHSIVTRYDTIAFTGPNSAAGRWTMETLQFQIEPKAGGYDTSAEAVAAGMRFMQEMFRSNEPLTFLLQRRQDKVWLVAGGEGGLQLQDGDGFNFGTVSTDIPTATMNYANPKGEAVMVLADGVTIPEAY